MGTWYIEILIRNREQIRSSIITKTSTSRNDEGLPEESETANLDDDVYNDLLIVEKTLCQLIIKDKFTEKEKLVLKLILDHKTLAQIKAITSMDEETTSDALDRICDKVASVLGEEFTDAGFLELFAKKYKLTEQQKEVARNFMNPKYKSTVKANE